MTPTERAKRSDALYYETVSVTRRVLCDMIANREADLEDARADNAKLRALCRDMYLVVELLDMDGARLQAHGKGADWRTLKERYNELEVVK